MPQGTPAKQKKRSKSVLKNIRKSARNTELNRGNRTRVRTAIKQMRTALASGNAEEAAKLLAGAHSEVDRAIRKGALKENTANRYKSRLTLALNSLRARKTA
jgi:small subunit ribosomal protein S20